MRDTRLKTITKCRKENKDADGFIACIAEDPNMESIMLRLNDQKRAREKKSLSASRRIAPTFKEAVRLIGVMPIKNTSKGTDKYKKGYKPTGPMTKKNKGRFKKLLSLGIKGLKKTIR